MKYITKTETALHSKLTMTIIIQNALMINFATTKDIRKMIFLKIYNKMNNYREIEISKAISHLLNYPDHYIDATFINIHTTHLFNHIKQFFTPQNIIHNSTKNQLDSEIIINNDNRLSISPRNIDSSTSFVYLTNNNQKCLIINEIINNFILNINQILIFHIIAEYILDKNKFGNQLLMKLFDEVEINKN